MEKFIFKMFTLLYVPIILICLNVLPFKYRFYYLVVMGIVCIIFSVKEKIKSIDLGFTRKNIKESFIYNFLLIILFVVVFLIAYYYGLFGRTYIPSTYLFYIFYVFISCPLQEFIYRSYLFVQFDKYKINNNIARILISAGTYSFLHLIYLDLLTVVATLIIGIIMGIIYNRTRNFYGVCISHIVFGTFSILAGLI